jgi:hypothetical protein
MTSFQRAIQYCPTQRDTCRVKQKQISVMYQLSLLFSAFANLLAYNGAASQSSVKQVGSLAFYSIVSSLSLLRAFVLYISTRNIAKLAQTQESIYLYINGDLYQTYRMPGRRSEVLFIRAAEQ